MWYQIRYNRDSEEGAKEVERESIIVRKNKGDNTYVSFSYAKHDWKPVPESPSVFRIRPDLKWSDMALVQEKGIVTSIPSSHSLPLLLVNNIKPFRPLNSNLADARKKLTQHAWRLGLDPLVAETWYSLKDRPELMVFF